MTAATNPTVDRTGLEVLDMPTSLALLASVPVGRLAMIDRGELLVVPVNHVVLGSRIAFRTGIGAKLDAGIMHHLVSFQADDWDPDTNTGWSVVMKGRAELADDPELLAELKATGVRPWATPEARQTWIVVQPSGVSGRRIVPRGGA